MAPETRAARRLRLEQAEKNGIPAESSSPVPSGSRMSFLSRAESGVLLPHDRVWALMTSGSVSKWTLAKIITASDPTNIAKSNQYLVHFFNHPTSSNIWLSKTSVMPNTEKTRADVVRLNKDLEKQPPPAPMRPRQSSIGIKRISDLNPAKSRLTKSPKKDVKIEPVQDEEKENPSSNISRLPLIHLPKERRFPFVPIASVTGTPPVLVQEIRHVDVQISPMHERPAALAYFSELRRLTRPTFGVDDGNTFRVVQVPFIYSVSSPLFGAPDTYLIISIVKKPSVLPAEEFHPRCLRIFLNDEMIQKMIPDGKAPYPQVPLEIPLSQLKTNNMVQISWVESTPEELERDYCLYIYLAKRKSVAAVVEVVGRNVLDLAKSLAQERDRELDVDIVTGTRIIQLNCPISKHRVVLPVRGKQCRHLQCYDAASFISLNIGPAARYLCPLCAQVVLPNDLVVDQFFQQLLNFTVEDKVELQQSDKEIIAREFAKQCKKPPPALTNVAKNAAYKAGPSNPNDSVVCLD